MDNIGTILRIIGFIFGGYYVLLLFAAAIWVYRDIHARTQDIMAQVLAVTLIIVLQLPFGLPLYLLMRPKQTLAERYEHQLEEEYLRRDLEDDHVCPNCQRGIEADFMVCPYCMEQLRQRCRNCDRTIDLTWSVCPFCATVPGTPPPLPVAVTDSTRQLEYVER